MALPGQSRHAHVFLSPHADDIVFSCAGHLASQLAASPDQAAADVFLVTVFLSGPQAETRRREDEKAAQLLGCQYRCLELPDALDRPEVRGSLDLFMPFGPPHLGITNEVLSRLLPWLPRTTTLYAPLGVGGHIDHRITHEAARAMAYQVGPTLRLAFYEDLPYALARYSLGRRLAALGVERANSVDNTDNIDDIERSTPPRERSAYADWLLSCPHMRRRMPGLRTLMAQVAAHAAVRADGDPKRHRPGFPPRLRASRLDVTTQLPRRAELLAAYASQWPLFAASPEAMAAQLAQYGQRLRPPDAAPNACFERIWFDDGVYGPTAPRT